MAQSEDALPSIRELANLVPLFLDPNKFANRRALSISDVRIAAEQALKVYQGCAEALELHRNRTRSVRVVYELPKIPGPRGKLTYRAFLREIIGGRTEADQTKRLRDYLKWASGLEISLGKSATDAERESRAAQNLARLKRDFKASDWDGIGQPFTRWWKGESQAKRQARASKGGKAKADKAKVANDIVTKKPLSRPASTKPATKKPARPRKQE